MMSAPDSLSRFIANTQNTHKPSTCASVAMVLLRLKKIYLNQETEESEALIAQIIKNIKEYFKKAFSSNPNLTDVLAYIDTVEEAQASAFDRVKVIENGQEREYIILLKEALALVFLALNDKKVFHSETDSDEKNLQERLRTLFNTLHGIQERKECHTGARNAIVLCLNMIYPGIRIIEDILSYLSWELTNFIEERLAIKLHEQPAESFSLLCNRVDPRDLNKDFLAFLSPLMAEAKQLLQKRCRDNGLNPEENELSKLIENSLNEIVSLPPPVGIHSKGPALVRVFEILYSKFPKCDEDVAKYLSPVENSLKLCRTFDDFAASNLHEWVKYYDVWVKIKIYQKFPFIGAAEGRLMNVIAFLSPRLKAYFERFPEVGDTSEIDSACREFASGASDFDVIHDIDFIQNFFAMWQIAGSGNKCYGLYHRLLQMQKTIFLSDSALHAYLEKNSVGNEVTLTPYIINRVLMHALLVSPRNWTPAFNTCFSRVLTFIVNNFRTAGTENGDARNAEVLRSSSYPEVLLQQMEFIGRAYHHVTFSQQSLSADFRGFFIPANLTGIQCEGLDDFIFYMNHIPTAKKESFANIVYIGRKLFLPINHAHILVEILNFLPKEAHIAFLAIIGSEKLKKILRGYDLTPIFGFLPLESCIELLRLMGIDTLNTIIKNRSQMIEVLGTLPQADRKTFLELLGLDTLRAFIADGSQLPGILYKLPEETRLALLKSIGKDILRAVIKAGAQLIGILNTLDWQSRMLFLELLGADILRVVINDSNQLISILKTLPLESHIDLLRLLGESTLRTVINDSSQLQNILKVIIFGESQRVFLELLGVDKLRLVITDNGQLQSILNALSQECHQECRRAFLMLLGIDTVRAIIKNELHLLDTLKTIDKAHRYLFLMSLGTEALKQLINSPAALKRIIETLPHEDEAKFFLVMGSTFLQLFEVSTLKILINENARPPMILKELMSTLDNLNITDRYPFLMCLGIAALKRIISSAAHLNDIVKILPEEDKIKFLLHLGVEFLNLFGVDLLRAVINDVYQLYALMELSLEGSRMDLLRLLGVETLKAVIENETQLYNIVGVYLPQDQRYSLLMLLGAESLKRIITTDTGLDRIVETLPVEDRNNFLHLLEVEFRRTDSDSKFRFFNSGTEPIDNSRVSQGQPDTQKITDARGMSFSKQE